MSSQRSFMPKKRKSYWSISEIGPSPPYNFIFFNILKIHNKFKQHSIYIKNYTAHPHDLVHIPVKFRENTAMRFWVTVRKLNVTARRTDGRALQYLPSPGLRRRREIKMTFRAIQPNLSYDMWFMSSQRSSMPKKKKSYWSVSEIDPSPTLDGRTDRRTNKSTLEKIRRLAELINRPWDLIGQLIGLLVLWIDTFCV